MAKSWQEKYEEDKKEQVKRLDFKFADMKEGEIMYISTPQKIAEYINSIPEGENRDILQMRHDLAKKVQADNTCPLTTGIFTRIVAEWSLELISKGKKPIAPFWKVVDPKSSLGKKLSCGPEFIEKMRNS